MAAQVQAMSCSSGSADVQSWKQQQHNKRYHKQDPSVCMAFKCHQQDHSLTSLALKWAPLVPLHASPCDPLTSSVGLVCIK